MLLTLKGTPFIYQGDELGMTNYPFKGIDEFDDIEVKNGWKANVLTNKVSGDAYLANLRKVSRDNSRTPMQWNNSANGGFTSAAKPWLAVNPNYKEINAAQELSDPNSIYNYFRQMLAFRKKTPAMVYGEYKDLDPQNPKVFIYTRTLGNEKYLVILNFSDDSLSYSLPGGLKAGHQQIANLGGGEEGASVLKLKAWEARVYKL